MDAASLNRLLADLRRAQPDEVDTELLLAYYFASIGTGEAEAGAGLDEDDRSFVELMLERSAAWKKTYEEIDRVARAADAAFEIAELERASVKSGASAAPVGAQRSADAPPARPEAGRRGAAGKRRAILFTAAALCAAAAGLFFLGRSFEKPYYELAFSEAFASPTRSFDLGQPELTAMKEAFSAEDYARAIAVGETARQARREGIEAVLIDQLLAESYLRNARRSLLGLITRYDHETVRLAVERSRESVTLAESLPATGADKDYVREKSLMTVARACLLLDDPAASRAYLERIVAMKGPLMGEAGALLEKLGKN